jgi:hypothetical protein
MFQIKVVEKSQHTFYVQQLPRPPESRVIYDMMGKNVVQPGRTRMTI